MSRREKARKMFELVETWRASGQTRQQFCATHDIKVSRLAYWINRKNQHDRHNTGSAAGGFIAVETSTAHTEPTKVALHYPNGVRLELAHTDEQLLGRLIKLW